MDSTKNERKCKKRKFNKACKKNPIYASDWMNREMVSVGVRFRPGSAAADGAGLGEPDESDGVAGPRPSPASTSAAESDPACRCAVHAHESVSMSRRSASVYVPV